MKYAKAYEIFASQMLWRILFLIFRKKNNSALGKKKLDSARIFDCQGRRFVSPLIRTKKQRTQPLGWVLCFLAW
jgi:hypothetical protein